MVQKHFFSLFFLLLAVANIADCKPPEISAREAHNRLEEVLKVHVHYNKLTPELVERTLKNYLEIIDPKKPIS